MSVLRIAFIALFTISAVSYVAFAQTDATPPGTIDESTPSAPPNTAATPDQDRSLSEKLKETEGVLKPPPAVDPEMRKPLPEAADFKMPVIIPPGEPGGDQTVQPK